MNTNTAEKLEEGTEVELENNVELEVDIIDDTPEQDAEGIDILGQYGHQGVGTAEGL